MADPQQRGRIPELDGLRGLAIFFVLLYHYITIFPHGRSHSLGSMAGTAVGLGSSGVDLFFILSGFLIGGILLDSKQSPRYYQTFYLRRFHRIVPLYYTWIILFAVISIWNKQFVLLRPYWIYFVFLQNYFYGQTPMQSMWFNATWSLAVEEQFYLLAPPFIRNVEPRRLIKVLLGIVAIAFLVRVTVFLRFANAVHDYWGQWFAYYATPSRMDDLALGVLAALLWRTPEAMQWITEHVDVVKKILIACLVILALTLKRMLMPSSFFQHTVGFSLFGVLYVSLMMVALKDSGSIVARTLRLRVLRELGRVSYCVYIIHPTVDWAVHKYLRGDLPRFDSPGSIGATFVAVGVTLLIAELSWRFFEHPLIQRGHQYKY